MCSKYNVLFISSLSIYINVKRTKTKYFVTLAKDAGYERTLLQLGRRIRDFFLNLDNLHDYLKYSFPKMKAPSFFIEV